MADGTLGAPNTIGAVEITGLKEFRAAVKQMEIDAPRKLKAGFNKAAEIVAIEARSRTPVGKNRKATKKNKGHRAGAARASIRVASNTNAAQVRAGGAMAPYFGFLDYGNKPHSGHGVGRGDSNPRPFIATGRILYPAFYEKRATVIDILAEEISELARGNGLMN